MDNTPNSILSSWIQDMEQQGRSIHTIAAYRRAMEHFIDWNTRSYGDAFNPAKVIPRDIRDWKSHQQSVENAAPATINQRLVALSRFYRWATKQGIASTNPTQDVPTVRLQTRQPKGIPDRDVRRLLREASGDVRDYAIIEVLIGTGIRVGEMLALHTGDITMNDRSGKLIVRQGKHDNYREIPLTLDVRKALASYLNVHPDPKNPKAALWWGQDGPMQHRSSILRILDKYVLRAGLDSVTPHMLRHTFATRYLAANPGDIRGLARLLGHSSLNTVMIYTEPHMDDLAERMERSDHL